MNVGLCDDNEIYLNYLSNLAAKSFVNRNDVVSQSISPEQLITLLNDRSFDFDILITDINLGGENAIDLAKDIYLLNPKCIVIFISNYLHFVSEVYEVPHVYFVLKSDAETHLPRAINKAITLYNERKNSFLLIHYQRNTYQIPLDNILYIEILGRYLYIHTFLKVFKCILPLKEIESNLNFQFCRCHKSYIVNFKRIDSLNRMECIMCNGKTIPISKTYSKTLLSAYWSCMSDE